MKNLVVFLEEPSAQEMLEGLLPRVLPEEVNIRYLVFDGKQDLEKQLVRKLRGWLSPDSLFLVLRDQDSADCRQVKQRLIGLCREAGKPQTLVRIACQELEAWYFGDLEAVETGLKIHDLVRHGNRAKYRRPDKIVNPSRELINLTHGRHRKIAGSRAIGPHLKTDRNTSPSFQAFLAGVRRLVTDD